MIAECPTDVMFESVHNPNDIDYLRSAWDSADQIISITYNPDQHDYMVFWKEKVPCSDCHKRSNCLAREEVQDESISKFADGEWWKEAQDD